MAFSGHHVGLTLGSGLSGGYMMRLAGRGIVDPVDATISQRCFYTLDENIHNKYNQLKIQLLLRGKQWYVHVSTHVCPLKCTHMPTHLDR